MKIVKLTYVFNDNLCLKSIVIDWNDTELDSNSTLIEMIAHTTLKSFYSEPENIELQDICNKLGIAKTTGNESK